MSSESDFLYIKDKGLIIAKNTIISIVIKYDYIEIKTTNGPYTISDDSFSAYRGASLSYIEKEIAPQLIKEKI